MTEFLLILVGALSTWVGMSAYGLVRIYIRNERLLEALNDVNLQHEGTWSELQETKALLEQAKTDLKCAHISIELLIKEESRQMTKVMETMEMTLNG